MDKYEYKIRTEEIKTLIAKGEYTEAAEIADGIDWRRVKSVMMLCTISDLYKVNRRYEDSRDLLLLAYDRHPGGRSIVYSLCELSVKMGEFVQAVEYYKEFVQVAPKDNGRYVLQYKLYEAQDVSLEERIEVLEELKSREYIEKWAYELAYLYHRVGLATKCVEECDELILWFGEGKYVMKAMELKMLHEPLTPTQQEKYDFAKGLRRGAMPEEEQQIEIETSSGKVLEAPTLEIPSKELDIQVKVMGVGQYDTINMQKELAEHMKELWEGTEEKDENGEVSQNTRVAFARDLNQIQGMTELSVPEEQEQQEPIVWETIPVEVMDFEKQEETDTGEVCEEAAVEEDSLESENIESEEEIEDDVEQGEPSAEPEAEPMTETEVFFGETGDMDKTASLVMEAMRNEAAGIVPEEETVIEESVTGEDDVPGQMTFGMDIGTGDMKEIRTVGDAVELAQTVQEEQPKETRRPYDKMLAMEYDGQFSLRLPESEQIEKQITGQINLEDVLRELEKRQKESEQKFRESVEQRVLEHTGAMFTEFEASIRDGLLEKLEREKNTDTVLSEDYDTFAEEENEEENFLTEQEELQELQETEESEEPDEVEELEEIETVEEDDTEEMLSDEAEETFEVDEEEEEAGEVPQEKTIEELLEEAEEEAEPVVAEFDKSLQEEDSEEKLEEEEISHEEFDEDESEEDEPKEKISEEIPEEPVEEEVVDEKGQPEPENKLRPLSPEEQELFGAYTHSQKSMEQIINAIDRISMASYTGNVIVTGDENMDTLTLAKNLVKEVQNTDSNFSGKIAKISGASLNQKNVEETVDKMANGALIIQRASGMTKETANKLHRVLEQEERGVIVILIDTKKAVNGLLKENSMLEECFTIRVDVEALSNKALVEFGKQYARENEYSIDEMGILALHTAIADRQSSDHVVTVEEVQEIIEEAIRRANRKTIGHFFDILIAKRYDDEDMIILREKDFM